MQSVFILFINIMLIPQLFVLKQWRMIKWSIGDITANFNALKMSTFIQICVLSSAPFYEIFMTILQSSRNADGDNLYSNRNRNACYSFYKHSFRQWELLGDLICSYSRSKYISHTWKHVSYSGKCILLVKLTYFCRQTNLSLMFNVLNTLFKTYFWYQYNTFKKIIKTCFGATLHMLYSAKICTYYTFNILAQKMEVVKT